MKVLACLGNPGRNYALNRHNIGFMIGEQLALDSGISLGGKLFSARSGKGVLAGKDALILLPQTFMNNSGRSVAEALLYYRAEPADLLVVHDEIELPFGDIRTKTGGGHKGHNGLRSIMQHAGTGDFHRLRFGVGRPENPEFPVADYVLSNFSPEERNLLGELIPKAAGLIRALLEKE